jgi:hypothetical protein
MLAIGPDSQFRVPLVESDGSVRRSLSILLLFRGGISSVKNEDYARGRAVDLLQVRHE